MQTRFPVTATVPNVNMAVPAAAQGPALNLAIRFHYSVQLIGRTMVTQRSQLRCLSMRLGEEGLRQDDSLIGTEDD